MVNVHVKFESDWVKTEVAIVSTRSKLTLTFDPVTKNQLDSSSHHGECACEVWKWLGKNWSRYCVHKVLYTECQSWPWPLTPWPKINRVPPLIINNLHVKFESDWEKTVVCIVSTRSYTQSAKFDLDLWPRDPKSIGFLLSSWWMCMWSLKVIGQKLWSLLCPQGLIHRVPKLTLTFDPVTQNQYGSSSHHGKCACEVWKWLGKNCSRYRVHNVKLDWPTHALTNPLTHSPNHPRTAALLYPLQRCCEGIKILAHSGIRSRVLLHARQTPYPLRHEASWMLKIISVLYPY